MNTIRCPMCDKLLPESALYCAGCGESMTSAEQLRFHPLSHNSSENATHVTGSLLVTSSQSKQSRPQTTSSSEKLNSEWSEIKRPATWHKDVALTPNRAKASPPPPRPVPSRISMLKTWHIQHRPRSIPPVFFLWASLLLLIFAIFGGVFGIVVTLGRGIDAKDRHNNELSLQVNPNNAVVGATVTLHGVNFSPHGHIGLSRDTSIPIMDTRNAAIVEADGNGSFNDTVAISSDWESGPHTLNAEDAVRHKVASFSILVTGHGASLRPAHLRISEDALDLGTADQATNTIKTITLTNVGGGQISWQSSSTQPWLVLSPSSGTFFSGHTAQIKAAIDRSKLEPGAYNAQIHVLSNAGGSMLPVKAGVTALLPEHANMLQLTPALLSFTAVDGGTSPSAQTVTISNPGLQQLKWQATTNVDWLSASPQSGTMDAAGSASVTLNVNTSGLLPGVYSGTVALSTQGSTAGEQLLLQVTVTVLPQCSLQVSPGILSFAGIYQQPMPATKMITIGTSCATPIAWNAVSNANWLTINTKSGNTPSTPSIGINVSTPGIYNSSIVFSSPAGTETLPVTFKMDQGAIPLVTTAPATMAFNSVNGKANPSLQRVSIANNGSRGDITWKAQVTTAVGGSWLTVSPATGTLAAHQSVVLDITTTILSTLVPGTYRGTVTITGIDKAGNPVLGSPQIIPISLIVKSDCTLAAVPTGLNFVSTASQPNPSAQQFAIQASTSCTNAVHWTATPATTSGGNWLATTPTGSATPAHNGIVTVSITSTNLKSNNYAGTVTIMATDSVTGQPIGFQVVPVTFSVQQSCTLQTPSSGQATFTAHTGTNPAAQTFTASVSGNCTGNVIITPTVTYRTGAGWLIITANTSAVLAGGTMTFTVTPILAQLPASQTYTASISLAATNSGGAIVGSSQVINVVLNVTPQAIFESTPTPSPLPVPSPTVVPSPVPTAVPTPVPTSTPVSAPIPTPTPAVKK